VFSEGLANTNFAVFDLTPSEIKLTTARRTNYTTDVVRDRPFNLQGGTTCCAKMAGKEETPKCRKKTVTWSNEMIEDLIDFIEIHPIVAFEAIYEPMLTSFW
jgi:hypothetical protein